MNFFGVDIGGSKIELAVFDRRFDKLDSDRVNTPTDNYPDFIDAIAELVERFEKRFGHAAAIGVGMAGIIDAQGQSLAANVACANGKNVKKDLCERLKREISVNNDCRLFALSEATGGAGEGYHHVFGAILGTGAGGGLVINRRLYISRQGINGEYGHLQLPHTLAQKYALPVRQCGCGLPNCFERFIGGKGLEFMCRHFGVNAVTVPQFLTLLRSEDDQAKQAFSCYMDILGASFATLILSYDPDVIVLGGGLSLIDEIVTGLDTAIRPHLFSQFSPPPIKPAMFGDTSGVRGAAIFASL